MSSEDIHKIRRFYPVEILAKKAAARVENAHESEFRLNYEITFKQKHSEELEVLKKCYNFLMEKIGDEEHGDHSSLTWIRETLSVVNTDMDSIGLAHRFAALRKAIDVLQHKYSHLLLHDVGAISVTSTDTVYEHGPGASAEELASVE